MSQNVDKQKDMDQEMLDNHDSNVCQLHALCLANIRLLTQVNKILHDRVTKIRYMNQKESDIDENDLTFGLQNYNILNVAKIDSKQDVDA